MPDRVTVEARLHVSHRPLRTVEKNAAHLRVRFLNNSHLALALQNFHRKWTAHHSGHPVRQAHHDPFRYRLSLGIGLSQRLQLHLIWFQVIRFERRLRLWWDGVISLPLP